jgi:hypothetical protein
VCNTVDAGSLFGAVLGLAYPPQGAPNWPSNAFPADSRLQGVVIHFEVFGYPNPYAVGDYAIADRGRTVIHEVGHYLGIRHIWGDGQGALFGGVDCTADDGIADTPNSGNNSQFTGCASNKNTCNDGVGDLPDMWENYMDYSEESCQNIFTQGQVDIMRSMLMTVRSGLLQLQCIDTVSAGIKNAAAGMKVKVFPNPANGIINIQAVTAVKTLQVKIADMLGNVVSENVLQLNGSSFSLHLGNFSSGVYFIIMQSENRFAVEKIILEANN